ncbi:Grx4 family monothiol glutaredoxin [Glycocaulis sp.]|uniref:Grx4 family monothiol glutaredoxin n=1 Tax=Glycocaulis sp. TaxID=1969725 RepID=UPI003D19AF10
MTDTATLESIRNTVEGHDVVLYMKGTPLFPQCGFSSLVSRVLQHMGVEYHSVNVLEDMEVREGIKVYSDWPTIPQLYVKGEFIGGCDIVKEMYETGELKAFFDEKGIEAA